MNAEQYQKRRLGLRKYVRVFYDLQRIRMQVGGRTKNTASGIELFEEDKAQLKFREDELSKAEKSALKDVNASLKHFAFYKDLLSEKPRYKGIGPTMAGVIMSEYDIHKADSPSKFWAFTGLAVIDGQRQRLKKGEKAPYNTFLKAKMVGVLADSLIKCKSPWTKYYYDKKAQWATEMGKCATCEGTGKYKKTKCGNCEGTGTGPRGKSDAHRHRVAMRYMVKMLLLDIWRQWRRHEGLAIRPSYGELHGDGVKDHLHNYNPEVNPEGSDPYDSIREDKAA